MDIFFADPNDVPLPPDEVKIRRLEARPYPDGQRIAVRFEITPFQQRPNIELSLLNKAGEKVAELSVVEVIENRMDFTMHLREENPTGQYKVAMRVFYTDIESFEPTEDDSPTVEEVLSKTGTTVDTQEYAFDLTPED